MSYPLALDMDVIVNYNLEYLVSSDRRPPGPVGILVLCGQGRGRDPGPVHDGACQQSRVLQTPFGRAGSRGLAPPSSPPGGGRDAAWEELGFFTSGGHCGRPRVCQAVYCGHSVLLGTCSQPRTGLVWPRKDRSLPRSSQTVVTAKWEKRESGGPLGSTWAGAGAQGGERTGHPGTRGASYRTDPRAWCWGFAQAPPALPTTPLPAAQGVCVEVSARDPGAPAGRRQRML